MGKNTKRNQKDRERSALLDLSLHRAQGTRPEIMRPEEERAVHEAEVEEMEGDAIVIRVDEDLEVTDVPLSDLPPSRHSKRTATTDEDRYFRWQLQQELATQGARLDRIPRSDVTHVRSHADLDGISSHLAEKSRLTKSPLIIGFDVEGKEKGKMPVLVQLAIPRLTAVIQLRSQRQSSEPSHIFEEGFPQRLADVFRLPNVVFVGQAITEELRQVAGSLRIPRKKSTTSWLSTLAVSLRLSTPW